MNGQVWATSSLGGYMVALNLSRELRIALRPVVKFRQFAQIKDATQQGLHRGATFHWNVFSKLSTGGTTIAETATMPESQFTITQGTLTVTEYGNSVPYTGKLDNLSEQPVREIVHSVLRIDAQETLDTAAAAQFDASPLRVVPTSGTSTSAITLTTNGTASATNNVALGKEHVKLIVDQLKERNIPAYEGGDDYYCIGRPSTFRTFKNDLEGISQYVETGFQRIRNGEIGRYESCRFVEQTHVAAGGIGTASAAWTNGASDWAVFFGNDTVAEAIVVPEEIRGKIPSDYGRSRGIAWYYLGGFGIVHTAAAEARVMVWDSAV